MVPSLCGIGYAEFNRLPLVTSVFTLADQESLFQVGLPGNGSIILGTVDVRLPYHYGVYRLDAVNDAAMHAEHGARIDFGFDHPTMLHGVFAGGSVDIIVIPEPATLALLGVGGLALVRRRGVVAHP